MCRARWFLAVGMILAAVSFSGCKAKQEKTEAGSGKPSVATQDKKVVVPVATPVLKEEVRVAAKRVLDRFMGADFSLIYQEASPGFKALGTESQFVAKFEETRKKVGALKNPQEISFDTRKDKGYVLVYRLANDRYISDIRLSFSPPSNGKVALEGINQHDEMKK